MKRTNVNICLVLVLGAFSLIGSIATAQQVTRCGGPTNALYINWPSFHFDVCHTGFNPYETKLSTFNVGSLVVDWVYATSGTSLYSSPAVVNGMVYIGGWSDGTVYALNATTGALLWKYAILDGTIQSSPTVANGVGISVQPMIIFTL